MHRILFWQRGCLHNVSVCGGGFNLNYCGKGCGVGGFSGKMCIFALANVPGCVPLTGARGQRLVVIAYELVLTTYGESAAGAHMVLPWSHFAHVSGILPVHPNVLGLRSGGVEGARSAAWPVAHVQASDALSSLGRFGLRSCAATCQQNRLRQR